MEWNECCLFSISISRSVNKGLIDSIVYFQVFFYEERPEISSFRKLSDDFRIHVLLSHHFP